MSTSVSLHALEPGGPGLPAASAGGIFIAGLRRVLEARPELELTVRWSRPHEEPRDLRQLRRSLADAGRDALRLLRDPARYRLVAYPFAPLLDSTGQPPLPRLARRAYRLAALSPSRRRLVVVVKDLPLDRAEGRSAAGGPATRLAADRVRGLEAVLFGAAHRVVLPQGLTEVVADRYGVSADRLRGYRRHAYEGAMPLEGEPPLEFDSGSVNFFFSGGVDGQVAPGFREVLRSIRNAPQTRLHVCGPGRDSVRKWLGELDVPNVRHHGRLGVAEHDRLASRCDVGLILDPRENPYNHRVVTLQYSAYLANGLAVLSTDLRQVTECLKLDGAGLAMPLKELALETLRWATRPNLWAEAKEKARAAAADVRAGADHQAWIDELVRGV